MTEETTPDLVYAFKCRECGHLEDDQNIGELDTPAACRNCGAGVSYDPRSGIKSYDKDNWIRLADLKGEELKEVLDFHGIKKADIVAVETDEEKAAKAEKKE